VAVDDFDGDGFVDLLFAGGFSPNESLRAVRGVGTGAFVGEVVQFDDSGSSVVSLMTADFDGDGLLDAALADPSAKRIRVWMDDDASSWPPFVADAAPDLYASTFAPTALAAGDVDGDGDLDLVYGGKNEVGLFLNDGQGFAYAPGTTFGGAYSATAVVLADLTGDGLDDLVLATPVRIRVFESLGGGVLGAPVSVHDAGVTTDDGLALGDLDQDGTLDLVAAFPTGVAWLKGAGRGGFAPPAALTDVPAQRLLVDDLDADGLADVVVVDDEAVRMVRSHGDGTFTAHDGAPLLPPITDLAAGDVNGDGRRDVVVSHEGGIAVLENLGDGRWPKTADLPASDDPQWGWPTPPAVADLDGDGDLDVLVGFSNAPRIYVNPGPAADWQEPLILDPGDSTYLGAVFAGDIDGSLGPDIVALTAALVVWPYTYEHRITVWRNTGPLTFAAPVHTILEDDGQPALSDLDVDGDLDVVVSTFNKFHSLLNDGSGVFSAPILATLGGAESFVLDDFDGDGRPDLAVGSISVLQGQGDGTFHFKGGAAAPGERLRSGDVDGDGLPDLLLGNIDSVVLVINHGNFEFGPAVTVKTGQPGFVNDAQAADVDGVPGAEIVCADDRQLFVLREEDGVFVPHSGYGTKAIIRSLLLADTDADGDLDALLGVSGGLDASITVLTGRQADPWQGLSGGLAGVSDLPELSGTGSLRPGTPMSLRVSRAAPDASVVLVCGLQAVNVPFKGGTLVPAPQLPVFGLTTSPLGTLSVGTTWPPGLTTGQGLLFQAWIADAAGPAGFAATNALMAVQP
ncbi:MAG TPA: VCBS repeat-containing protein, partial [Ilumatobacteraceae bacterium]|nr:VCBS repeat-containing protein [Ilumatobacteraceae bacterium]